MTQQYSNRSERSNTTRRNVLKAGLTVSAAAVGVSASGVGMAQSEMDLSLSVDAEAELVTITNNGDSEVDLTGYQMNFEAGEDSNVDQIRTLAGTVTIGAGESVTVATGAGESGDVSLEEPYDGEVLNNEEDDVVAVLSPEGDVVVTSNGSSGSGSGSDETYTVNARVEYSNNTPATGTVTALGHTHDVELTKEATPESPATFDLLEGTYNMIARIPDELVDEGGYGEETITVGPDGVEEILIVTDGSAPSDEEEDEETHTMTVVVVDNEGEPLEGVDVGVAEYDSGADAGEGTTDENGEVEFELTNGDYEFLASHDTLYQSSANRLSTINGEDNTFEITLAPAGEVDEPAEEQEGEGESEEESPDSDEDKGDDEGDESESDENEGDEEVEEEGDSSEDDQSDDEPADDAEDEETTDKDASSQDKTTDADDDGVPASEDSDDDCAKVN